MFNFFQAKTMQNLSAPFFFAIIVLVLRSENFINFSFLRSTLKCADCMQYLQSSGQLPVFIDTSDASWTSAFLKDSPMDPLSFKN